MLRVYFTHDRRVCMRAARRKDASATAAVCVCDCKHKSRSFSLDYAYLC